MDAIVECRQNRREEGRYGIIYLWSEDSIAVARNSHRRIFVTVIIGCASGGWWTVSSKRESGTEIQFFTTLIKNDKFAIKSTPGITSTFCLSLAV